MIVSFVSSTAVGLIGAQFLAVFKAKWRDEAEISPAFFCFFFLINKKKGKTEKRMVSREKEHDKKKRERGIVDFSYSLCNVSAFDYRWRILVPANSK